MAILVDIMGTLAYTPPLHPLLCGETLSNREIILQTQDTQSTTVGFVGNIKDILIRYYGIYASSPN